MRNLHPIVVALLIWLGVLVAIPVIDHRQQWIPPVWYELRDSVATTMYPAFVPVDSAILLDMAEADSAILRILEDDGNKQIIPSPGLDAFFASLGEASHTSIRVLHYGDSQIEEDRMTSILRLHLQDRFGGDGVGLIPLHAAIPTRTMRQRLYLSGRLQKPSEGPKRYLVFGPQHFRAPDHQYGPLGQCALMSDSVVPGSEQATLTLTPLRPARHSRSFHHSEIRLLADTSIHMTRSDTAIHLEGRGRVFALSLETPTGIHVDNIAMRSCPGTIFTRMDTCLLRDQLRALNTRLIILQFGGNFIGWAADEANIRNAVASLTTQVRLLRRLLPEVSILFVGPSDMLFDADGTMESSPMVDYMDRLLERMAAHEQIAYYSLYHAMGGAGSMAKWHEQGLGAGDGVHFSQRGADKAGEALYRWIEDQYTLYLQSH